MEGFRGIIESYTPKTNTAEFQKARTVDGKTQGLLMFKQLMALSNLADATADLLGSQGDAATASRIREFSTLMRNEANKKKNVV